MEFKNDDGLRLRIVSNGFVDKTGFYTINYRAPVLYYYDRDYTDYAKLVRSFRQSKGAFDRRRRFRAGRSFLPDQRRRAQRPFVRSDAWREPWVDPRTLEAGDAEAGGEVVQLGDQAVGERDTLPAAPCRAEALGVAGGERRARRVSGILRADLSHEQVELRAEHLRGR